MSDEAILTALDASAPALSLDATYGDTPLENVVGVDNISEFVESLSLRQLIDALPLFEKQLITLRYFKNLTQSQTAKILGVTQVKISREERKIIEKFRVLL